MAPVRTATKTMALVVALSLFNLGLFASKANAAMVPTATVVDANRIEHDRARITALLARDDVKAYLERQGIDAKTVQSRVASLTDNEVRNIAGRLDQLPAGGDLGGDLIGAALVIFIILLITDILGLTDVFPFVKKHH